MPILVLVTLAIGVTVGAGPCMTAVPNGTDCERSISYGYC